MKKLNLNPFVFFILLGILGSCEFSGNKNAKESEETETISSQSDAVNEVSADNQSRLSLHKWYSLIDEKNEYYILNYAATAEEKEAIEEVNSLRKTYPNAGYLWIPDFASLSGSEVFVVFLDQTKDQSKILELLDNSKAENPSIYAVRVNQSSERWAAYNSGDIRINGQRINADSPQRIYIYQTPTKIDEYEEEGGEDWGYFTEEVSKYFEKRHPTIKVDEFYNGSLSSHEIKYLEEKLDLKSQGFGYILTDGDTSLFIEHNMSDEVISQAKKFFGLKK